MTSLPLVRGLSDGSGRALSNLRRRPMLALFLPQPGRLPPVRFLRRRLGEIPRGESRELYQQIATPGSSRRCRPSSSSSGNRRSSAGDASSPSVLSRAQQPSVYFHARQSPSWRVILPGGGISMLSPPTREARTGGRRGRVCLLQFWRWCLPCEASPRHPDSDSHWKRDGGVSAGVQDHEPQSTVDVAAGYTRARSGWLGSWLIGTAWER